MQRQMVGPEAFNLLAKMKRSVVERQVPLTRERTLAAERSRSLWKIIGELMFSERSLCLKWCLLR